MFHYLNKCLTDRFFFIVMSILNHPASASHHRGNGIRRAGEDPAVEQHLVFCAGDKGILAIQYDKIGPISYA